MIQFEAIQPSDIVVARVHFTFDRRESIAGNRRELASLLRYTEFIGWWGWALGITSEQAQSKPVPEDAWAYVEQLAYGNPPDDGTLSILNCALHDREGNRRLHWGMHPNGVATTTYATLTLRSRGSVETSVASR